MWWYMPSMFGVFNASWHATFLVVMVLAFQMALRKKLLARWRFALWLLVLVRLSGVALPESRLSVFNWVPRSPVVGHIEGVSGHEAGVAVRTGGEVSHAARAVGGGGFWGWVWGAYAIGLGVMGVRIAVSMGRAQGIVKRSVALEDVGVRARLGEARRVMGVGREVALVVSEEMGSPALVGWWRPVMVVPRRLIGELTNREWEFVFLHECAHLKRNDVLVNYWMAVLGAVHWFNPVAWAVWPRVRADRELACDEQVVMTTGEAGAYGETLLKMFDGATRLGSPAAVGVIGTKAFFKRRIQMIAGFRKRPAWVAMPAVGLLLVIGAATLTSAVTAAVKVVDTNVVGVAAPGVKANAADEFLGKEVPEMTVDEQPLSKVLDTLRDKAGINLVVSWKAVEAAGIDRNAPVSVHVTKVPVRKMLELVLTAAGGPNGGLDYDVDDGVVMVSTKEDLGKTHTVLRIYNVRDLLLWGHTATIRSPQEPHVTGVSGAQKPPLNAATGDEGTGHGEAVAADPQDVEKLRDILMSVDPQSWMENGGTVGSIVDFHGLLTITTTRSNHEKIEKILATLRAANREDGKSVGG